MKLKNTPWTCEFEPMQNWHIKDNSGYWFALAIEDADTARAIAALPETLSELERHKKLHQGMLDALTQAEKERDELKEFVQRVFESSMFPNPIKWAEMYKQAQQLLTPKD